MRVETCLKSKRDIIFTKAGSHVRARFAGCDVSVLAPDRHLAISRLRHFDLHDRVEPTNFQKLLQEALHDRY